MNIYVLSHDPDVIGSLLCDQHLRECGITYTQLLVNQHNIGKPPAAVGWTSPTGVYTSPQKVDHPCNKWVAEGAANYMWLAQCLQSVWREYKYRFGADHVTWETFGNPKGQTLSQPPKGGKMSGFTSPPCIMPDEFIPSQAEMDKKGGRLWATIEAYKQFYGFVNGHWTKRNEPSWMSFPGNRFINPMDKEIVKLWGDIELRKAADLAFKQHKAIVDAKYVKPPTNFHGDKFTSFKKTFKRIY